MNCTVPVGTIPGIDDITVADKVTNYRTSVDLMVMRRVGLNGRRVKSGSRTYSAGVRTMVVMNQVGRCGPEQLTNGPETDVPAVDTPGRVVDFADDLVKCGRTSDRSVSNRERR